MKVYAETFEEYTNLIQAFVEKGLTFEAGKSNGRWVVTLTGGF